MDMRDLGGVASALLAAFIKHLTDMGIEIPERQYVAPGSQVPWDGEQLVCNLQSIDPGHVGAPTAMPGPPRAINLAAQFQIALVREVPALNGEGSVGMMTPDSEALNEAGLFMITDSSALLQVGILIGENYEIVSPGMGWLPGPVMPLGPEGGLAGNRILLNMSLS